MRAAKPCTYSVRETARALVESGGKAARKRKVEIDEMFLDGGGEKRVRAKKEWKGLTKDEKMREVARDIMERGGLKRELLFRGEGKQAFCSTGDTSREDTVMLEAGDERAPKKRQRASDCDQSWADRWYPPKKLKQALENQTCRLTSGARPKDAATENGGMDVDAPHGAWPKVAAIEKSDSVLCGADTASGLEPTVVTTRKDDRGGARPKVAATRESATETNGSAILSGARPKDAATTQVPRGARPKDAATEKSGFAPKDAATTELRCDPVKQIDITNWPESVQSELSSLNASAAESDFPYRCSLASLADSFCASVVDLLQQVRPFLSPGDETFPELVDQPSAAYYKEFFGDGNAELQLSQPRLENGDVVRGAEKRQWKKITKATRNKRLQEQVEPPGYWKRHKGNVLVPPMGAPAGSHRGGMCPSNVALQHPAGPTLQKYATDGCPVESGRLWTREEVEFAVSQGPHEMDEAAMVQFAEEAYEKEKKGLVKIVSWDELKKLPDELFPKELKVSPIFAVPHKSRNWRAILDLSFGLKMLGREVQSVNDASTKTAPRGAIDQLGHALQRIIYCMATAPEGKKIYAAKWDIKDGFWRMVCEEGAEYNFAYVLPSVDGSPPKLVIPTSLQMGWLESPGYFCAGSETARDVMELYAETHLGALPTHKFEHFTQVSDDYHALPTILSGEGDDFLYNMEVFVDDFMGLAVAESQEQLDHIARAALHGLHDVFPPDDDDDEDPNSVKKLRQRDGAWALVKELLGFNFDGLARTLLLSDSKKDFILSKLKEWVRLARKRGSSSAAQIDFKEFRSMVGKLRHAAICIPAGSGLLSESTKAATIEKKHIHMRVNGLLFQEMDAWRSLIREATKYPTKCTELITGHPDYIGIVDASTSEGVGGVIVGENTAMVPTVFRLEWPPEVLALVKSNTKPDGKLTNSDLEMAGQFILWLVIERVCPELDSKHVALLDDNAPTVSWIKRMTSTKSDVAAVLLRLLAMRLKGARASPLIPMHIPGPENSISDIPSRSFGGKAKWHCKTDAEFLTLFNSSFPLPNQTPWRLYHLPPSLVSRVISVLVTQASEPAEWRLLKRPKTSTGGTGRTMRKLWEWTLSCRSRRPPSTSGSGLLPDLQAESELATSAMAARLELNRCLRRSRPLARRFPWCAESTP